MYHKGGINYGSIILVSKIPIEMGLLNEKIYPRLFLEKSPFSPTIPFVVLLLFRLGEGGGPFYLSIFSNVHAYCLITKQCKWATFSLGLKEISGLKFHY